MRPPISALPRASCWRSRRASVLAGDGGFALCATGSGACSAWLVTPGLAAFGFVRFALALCGFDGAALAGGLNARYTRALRSRT